LRLQVELKLLEDEGLASQNEVKILPNLPAESSKNISASSTPKIVGTTAANTPSSKKSFQNSSTEDRKRIFFRDLPKDNVSNSKPPKLRVEAPILSNNVTVPEQNDHILPGML